MQTGSGISHEERFHEPGTSIFQIWFEPDLNKSIKDPAQYHYLSMNGEANKESFSRQLIGESSVKLDADAKVYHYRLKDGKSTTLKLKSDRVFAIVAFKGELNIDDQIAKSKEFLVIDSIDHFDEEVILSAKHDCEFILVDVPKKVDYPLIRK